jgi:hypothetical protein
MPPINSPFEALLLAAVLLLGSGAMFRIAVDSSTEEAGRIVCGIIGLTTCLIMVSLLPGLLLDAGMQGKAAARVAVSIIAVVALPLAGALFLSALISFLDGRFKARPG